MSLKMQPAGGKVKRNSKGNLSTIKWNVKAIMGTLAEKASVSDWGACFAKFVTQTRSIW